MVVVYTKKSARVLSVLLAVFIILPVFICLPIRVQAASTVDITIDDVTRKYKEAAKWLGYVNDKRAEKNLPALVMDTELLELAMKHSAELSVYVSEDNLDGTSFLNSGSGMRCVSLAHGQIISRASVINDSNLSILNSSLKSIGIGYVTGKGNVNYLTILTSTENPKPVDSSVLTQSNFNLNQSTKCLTSYLKKISLNYQSGNVACGANLQLKFVVSNLAYEGYTAFVSGDTNVTTTNSSIIKVDNPDKLLAIREGEATIGMYFKLFPDISATSDYKVVTKSFSGCTIEPIPDQIYTGRAITPAVTVTSNDGKVLKVGTDYSVTYYNNINVGIAGAVVNGMNSYYGKSGTVNFNIVDKTNAFTINVITDKSDITLGDSVSITAVASNGKAPVKYKFDYSDSGSSSYYTIQSEGTSDKCSFKPSKIGSYTVRVTAKDSQGKLAVSNVQVNVRDALKCTASVSPASITVGNTVNIKGNVTGGTSPYSYEISVKKPGSSGYTVISKLGSSSSVSYKPETSGSYEFRVLVKDSKDSMAVDLQTLTVKDTALVNKSTVSAASVSVGTKVTLTGLASGGAGSYKYAFYYKEPSSSSWKTIGTEFGTASTAAFTPDKSGSYSVRIDVKDKSGTVKSKTFTVNSKINALVNSSKVSAANVKKGTKVTITAVASGGLSPYQYAYYYKAPSSSSWTAIKGYSGSTTAGFTPDKVGNYSVKIDVKDSVGTVKSKTLTVKAEAKLLVNNSRVSSTSVKSGTKVTITASAAEGTGSYKYAFYYKAPSASGWSTIKSFSTSNTASFIPTNSGNYSVRADVKDGAGTVVSKTFTVKCTVKPLVNNSKISSTGVQIGNKVTITAAASEGTGSYKYAFYYKAPSSSKWTTIRNYSTTKTATFTPNKTGSYSIRVDVKDSAGTIKTKTFTVKSASKALVNNSKVSSTNVKKGGRVSVTAAASGGKGSYRYAFYYKAPSSSKWTTIRNYSTSKTATFTPAKTGSYSVRVNIKDGTGTVKTKNFTVKVTAKNLVNSSKLSSTSIKAGSKLTLKAAASGGTSPYKYAYYYKKSSSSKWVTLKGYSTTKSASVILKSKGTYNVRIAVKDASNKTVYKTYNVKVK